MTEAEIQRKKDLELIETTKKTLRQTMVKSTLTKLTKNLTSKNLTSKNLAPKTNQNTITNLDKILPPASKTQIQAASSMGSQPNKEKDDGNKDNRPLVYLLNDIVDEKDPVPLPASKLS